MKKMIKVVAGALLALILAVPGPSTMAAAPQPTITTSLTFAPDCSWARVTIVWSNWRTNQVVLSLKNTDNTADLVTPYVLNAGRESGGFKASRSGSWGTYFYADWTGDTMRGFGSAVNTRRGGIIDLTDSATCSTGG